MDKLRQRVDVVVRVILICLISQLMPNASAAGTIIFDANKSGCSTLYQSSNIFGNRFRTSSQVTITAIDVSIGSGPTTNFSTSSYYIMSDSGALPNTVLATFLPSSVSGSGSTTIAQFTNSGYTISANTFVWIVPAQQSITLAQCYANGVYTADQFGGIGINVDTSTSLSNSNWPRSYTTNTTPISASWVQQGNTPLVWQLALESSPSVPVSVSLASTNGVNSAVYRTYKSISATVNSASNVTFYQNGKKINGCIKVPTSAGTAVCNWKPSQRGTAIISATAYPTSGSYLNGNSSQLSINVGNRVNPR